MEKVIGIFGVPRSGTSWLGQIFNSSEEVRFAYQPMFTEKFRDVIHARSSKQEMRDYFELIYNSKTDFLQQEDGKEKGTYLQFKKSKENPAYFVFKEVMYLYLIPRFLRNLPNMKIIFIIRNPYAVLQSWYNAPKEFYPEWDIEKEWLFAPEKNWFLPERYYGYHRWKEAIALAKSLLLEFPDRVYVLKYEDLDTEPIKVSEKLFQFAGINFSKQTREFITDSRSRTDNNPYSIYRNPTDRKTGQKKLPDTILEQLNYDILNFNLSRIWYNPEELSLEYLK